MSRASLLAALGAACALAACGGGGSGNGDNNPNMPTGSSDNGAPVAAPAPAPVAGPAPAPAPGPAPVAAGTSCDTASGRVLRVGPGRAYAQPSAAAAVAANGDVIRIAAGDVPGADRITAPNFWPAATLLSQLPVAGVPEPGYLQDAPAPYQLRAITATGRLAGALQAAP